MKLILDLCCGAQYPRAGCVEKAVSGHGTGQTCTQGATGGVAAKEEEGKQMAIIEENILFLRVFKGIIA